MAISQQTEELAAMVRACPGCAKQIELPADPKERQRHCPHCGALAWGASPERAGLDNARLTVAVDTFAERATSCIVGVFLVSVIAGSAPSRCQLWKRSKSNLTSPQGLYETPEIDCTTGKQAQVQSITHIRGLPGWKGGYASGASLER